MGKRTYGAHLCWYVDGYTAANVLMMTRASAAEVDALERAIAASPPVPAPLAALRAAFVQLARVVVSDGDGTQAVRDYDVALAAVLVYVKAENARAAV